MVSKEERFKEIIGDNESKIRRICRYYATSEEESKDIYQEVLVNIWKSLDSFRGDSALSTWIYRIAVNTSLSISGKSLRQTKLHLNLDTAQLASLTDESDFDSEEKFRIRHEALLVGLNQLSVIDKALISLVLEGLSMKEIAQVIGLTEPNVRVKIHRIKDSLRETVSAQLAD